MKRALVVIDMQNDFIDGALVNPMAQAIVEPICEYIKKFNGHILATLDTHGVDYLNSNEGKHLPIEHCIYGTKGWLLNEKIEKVLLDRNGLNPFIKTAFGCTDKKLWGDLDFYDTIELCGVCTDICVISNALIFKSMYPEKEIIVHANLCAGTTKEMHENALKVMQSCQIEVKR